MAVSNGQQGNQNTFNTAFLSRTADSDTVAVLGLNNTTDANSGSQILNVQRSINGNIQNERIFGYIANDNTASFSTDTITLNDDLILNLPEVGFTNTITAASFVLSDGQHLYATLDRTQNATLSTTISNNIPTGTNGQDIIRIASRVGAVVVWFDNTYHTDGSAIKIGQGGGGSGSSVGGYQEKIGTGDGVTTSFNMLLFPINENSIIVFSNTVNFLTTDWTYSSNQIDFVTAPDPGVEIYVFYLTSGQTITAPNPSVESFNGDGATVLYTLGSEPSSEDAVEVFVNGLIYERGTDYTVSADEITFTTAPAIGQRINFRYV